MCLFMTSPLSISNSVLTSFVAATFSIVAVVTTLIVLFAGLVCGAVAAIGKVGPEGALVHGQAEGVALLGRGHVLAKV